MHGSILVEVVSGLDSYRGIWKRISDETGVAYSTLQKIAQGRRTNPRLQTVIALHEWLKDHGGIPQPAKQQQAAALLQPRRRQMA